MDGRRGRLSAVLKKKAFDRGGPVWPSRSNAADDRLGGGESGGDLPPQPKFGRSRAKSKIQKSTL